MKLDAPPPLPHSVRYEREITQALETTEFDRKGWKEYAPTGTARTSCTCGQLDTGYVGADEAYRAAQEHVKRELPGVDWGPDLTPGPVRPSEEPTA